RRRPSEMTPDLSVVLPAYNEAAEIGRTVDALVEAIRRSGLAAEVILVDDGSTDETVAVAEQRAAGRLPLRVLRQRNSCRLEAFAAFRSYYPEQRFSNDDTPVLRWIAERHGIGVSPHFSAMYVPRTRMLTFLRHSFRRGTVFLDGHGRRESRFFWPAVDFYP